MRALSEIIKSNRDAVRCGLVQPGELIGTSDVVPDTQEVVEQEEVDNKLTDQKSVIPSMSIYIYTSS